MLSTAAISRYETEGFLFPLRAFAGDVAAAYRADVERTCADSSEAAAAFSGSRFVSCETIFAVHLGRQRWCANQQS